MFSIAHAFPANRFGLAPLAVFRCVETDAWPLPETDRERTCEPTCRNQDTSTDRPDKSTVVGRWANDLWEDFEVGRSTNARPLGSVAIAR